MALLIGVAPYISNSSKKVTPRSSKGEEEQVRERMSHFCAPTFGVLLASQPGPRSEPAAVLAPAGKTPH